MQLYGEWDRCLENMNRILLSGYYGFGNTGDDAILEAIVSAFRAGAPGCTLRVLTKLPSLSPLPENVIQIPRMDLLKIIQAIYESDLVISGGGGLIQDTTSFWSLCYYLGILFLAQIMRKKTMVFSQSIGPVIDFKSERLIKFVLNRVDCISVRDETGGSLLRKLGVETPVAITRDPVFLLNLPSPKEADAVMKREELASNGDKSIVVVVIRKWQGAEKVVDILSESISQWFTTIDKPIQIVILPFQISQDLHLSQLLADKLSHKIPVTCLSKKMTTFELLAIISQASFVVSMRLHALIFSALSNVPFLGLAYDPKVEALAEELGQPVLRLDELTVLGVGNKLSDIWGKLEENRRQIANFIPGCRLKAKEAVRLALSLLR